MLRFLPLALAAPLLLAPAGADAHPHQWIDVASELLYNDRGAIEAVRHHWRFDEGFSTFALQGLDTDRDGAYSAEELQPLAQENIESLADFDFFTFLSAGDYRAGFAAPRDYGLDLDGGRLTLHFTLPLAQPFLSKGEVLLQVYDPEYYIAFALPSAEAVRLVGAPAGCRLDVEPAQAPDAQAAAALATIGPDQRELPAEMEDLTGGIDNSATVHCGGPVIAGGQGSPQSAGEAVTAMATGPASPIGDLSALPAESPGSQGTGRAQAKLDGSEPPSVPISSEGESAPAAAESGGLAARLGAMQVGFQRQLTETLKELKSGNTAFWWLGGISFLYGIVHAAGPGHGKVVISSYLLANEERVRRGVGIAFLSALVQALVAIGIVGLMAAVLNMTSTAMTGAARLLEVGSFALVLLLGLYLLWSKGRQAWRVAAPAPQVLSAHHHHHAGHHQSELGRHGRIQWDDSAAEPGMSHRGHHHAASCACQHHAAPEILSRGGAAGAAAAVLSVGLRPCSGALIVLVFALAQGIFWAGVASTFLMALGTAITVAALAALAVGAKDVALRLSQGDGRRSGQVMLALELAAAFLVTALGAVLLLGSLQA